MANRLLMTALSSVLMFLSPAALAQQADSGANAATKTGPGVLELREKANQAYQKEDYSTYLRTLEKLHEMRPYNSTYMTLLVEAHAQVKDLSGAYNMMLKMQQQGLAHDFSRSEVTESIRGTEAYDYINGMLVQAFEPLGEAELMFELPADLQLATSITWDPSRSAFLVGDAIEGAIHAVTAEGEVTRLLAATDENGLWSVFGLVVDAENNRLWVSSSANQAFQGYDPVDAGRSALFEFELESLELVKRYPVPVDGKPHSLGGIVLLPDGDIYSVDTLYPIIYRLKKGDDRLRPYLASADMVSLRGITSTGDGSRLFVADYELGIMGIDIASSQFYQVRAAPNLNLGGIEGLQYWNGNLVIIQNGNEPHRVMRLELDQAGLTIQDVAPLAVAQPFFDYPSFGVVRGEELVFLANSHWVRNKETLSPLRVARTSLSGQGSLADIDTDALLRQMQERAATKPINPAPLTTLPERED